MKSNTTRYLKNLFFLLLQIEEAMKEIPDELLDAPIGNLEVDGGRLSI